MHGAKPANPRVPPGAAERLALPVWTVEELAKCNASNPQICISILSVIYDVSSDANMFGAKGSYGLFAGHDCTYNLAVMSLEKTKMNQFGGAGTYSLTDPQRESLANWVGYFGERYPPVGRLEAQHPFTHEQLTEEGGAGAGDAEQDSASAHSGNASADDISAGGLASRLWKSTVGLHTKTLRHPFAQDMMDASVTKKAYTYYLQMLYYFYEEFEFHIRKGRLGPFAKIHDPRLERLKPLETDLQFLLGDNWKTVRSRPSMGVVNFLSRIHDIAAKPHLLAVHHYFQYGALISGGQMLKATVARALDVLEGPGIAYHTVSFEDVQKFGHQYFQSFDEAGAAGAITPEMAKEMEEEGVKSYTFNLQLFEEAHKFGGEGYDSPGPKAFDSRWGRSDSKL